MKFLMALLICFSATAFADHHEEMEKKLDSMSFEDAKKMKLEHIDKMQAALDENRKCINDSKDKDGLKACREKAMAKRKEFKEKMKAMKNKKDKKKKK
jgi:hypothetical protein